MKSYLRRDAGLGLRYLLVFYLPSMIKNNTQHCVKSFRIRSYSGPHFSAFFRIRTEEGEILLRIQSECGKMREKCGPE